VAILPVILRVIVKSNPSLKDAFDKSEALVQAIKKSASDGVIDKKEIVSLTPDLADVFFTIYSLFSKKDIKIKVK